jgi:phytoene dehydrogenase-like protein
VQDGAATGVVLADGEEIRARLVLSNADPKRTLLDLVGEQHLEPSVVTEVRRYRMEGCSYKINCALDALPRFSAIPEADQERYLSGGVVICPSIDYLERAYQEAVSGRPSRRPYVLIHFQTLTDPSLAPEGKHTMTLFGDYAPYHRSDGPWTAENKRALAEDVLDTVAEYAPNVREVLRDFMILTPPDIEQRFGISGGHIFHGDLTPEQLLSFRPIPGYSSYRMPLDNLYLCGSGAHPGGYVSGIPGRNAASVVLGDWNRRARS